MKALNHLYIKISVCAAFFFGLTSTIQAQELTLEEVTTSALEYSRSIKNGNLRAEQAALIKREAVAKYFPEVEAMAFGVYGFENLIPPITGILPNGIDNFYGISATASQVVYAGGKVNLANDLAQLQADSRLIGAEESRDSVLLNVESKFWQLIKIQEQQEVIASSKIYLNELLKQQTDLLEAGLIAKSQLLRVKVEKSGLLLKQNDLNNKRKIALLDLALYAGINYDTTLVAIKGIHEKITPPQLKYKNPELDLQNNNKYRLLQHQLDAAELQVKNEKADLLPKFAVGFSAAKFDSFNTDLGIDVQPIAFGTLSIPISAWWSGEKRQVEERQIAVTIAENKLKDGEDQLTLGIMKSWYDLQNAYKQIQYAEDRVLYAQENLKSQKDNYDSGLNNLTDLLDARSTQEEAKAALVSAYADYEVKEAMYLYSTNQLQDTFTEN
ncbi:Outer membrane protein TolC [Mesonia phycicola]|uniref:Outer membrane protein TolC n=1 Tax=Mesonia phycicola TaxID=579105 RepID=A0A1M6FBA9_9FLAO|nr:TolC family protein [Mesonia phycicola]SHI94990.1 Outer membrane protein TolC [Mesonia phycicola]